MAKTGVLLKLDPELLARVDGVLGGETRTGWITEAILMRLREGDRDPVATGPAFSPPSGRGATVVVKSGRPITRGHHPGSFGPTVLTPAPPKGAIVVDRGHQKPPRFLGFDPLTKEPIYG